jgi:hypothetical protein
LLKQMTELRFERSRLHIACTVGRLAEALSAHLARGARTLRTPWKTGWGPTRPNNESHLERGHLVLCVELRTSEDFSVGCGKLVQTSRHMVELCNVMPES